jgi:uncharacterized protein YbjT (DUF2867 family)
MNTPAAGQKLVIVGATGMVGSYALRYAFDHIAIERMTAIGQEARHLASEADRSSALGFRGLLCVLMGQDAAIFCLGAYTGVVTDAELRRVTVDYTVEFARVLRASSPDAAFSFLSGNGADPTGRTRMAFARYKGEAEKALLATGFPRVYIFRPAYIYPVEPRKEPNFSYRLLRWVYPVFRVAFPNLVIRSDRLARAMVDVAVERTSERQNLVFENRDIKAIALSHHSPRP